jgi:hypothetical protein
MSSELSPEEKHLIELEFVAREETRAKRRTAMARVCWIGVSAYLLSAFVPRTEVGWVVLLLLRFIWVVCAGVYTSGHVFPATFTKDIDPWWHTNPWQDAMQDLSEGGRQIEVLALILVPQATKLLTLAIIAILQ